MNLRQKNPADFNASASKCPLLVPSVFVQSGSHCLSVNNHNPVVPHSSVRCHGDGACGDRRALFIVGNQRSGVGITAGRDEVKELLVPQMAI